MISCFKLNAVFSVRSVLLAVIVSGFLSGCDPKTDEKSSEKELTQVINTEQKGIEMNLKKVKLQTSLGDVVIELNEEAAPVTTANFQSYVTDGFYDGTIFHRVISGFMIQGGGFTEDMANKRTKAPIVNEASNGLKNDRGTIAMARTNNPDSATSQFFINHNNNDSLNYSGPRNLGYAVFGKVVEGMDIVDAIAKVKTTSRQGHDDVPVEPIVIESASFVSEE